nr:hypothetical protein [Tanacetum cinerariifolium]
MKRCGRKSSESSMGRIVVLDPHHSEKSVRIIPGPTGIVQAVKLHKIADTREGGEESIISTQDYIRKVIKDDNFTRGSWVSAVEFVNVDGGS